MTIERLYEEQLKSFRYFFPNIALNESDIKKRFLRRYSKFPGVNKTEIHVIPDVKDNDARWLKLCELMREFITRETRVVGSIHLDPPLKPKDADRLLCIPSASMVPTIGNPEYLLDIKYSQRYMDLYLECLELIKEEVGKPDINTTVRKRKNSSSGSFISSMDTKTFAALFANFEKELLTMGHKNFKQKIMEMPYVYTIPITRRMIKSPKIIEDYTIDGRKVKISRKLDEQTVNEIKLSEKELKIDVDLSKLVGPKHRSANNISEPERMTHFYYQVVVDSERAKFPLSMKYDENYIHDLVDEVNKYNENYLKMNNIKPKSKEEFLDLDGIYNFFSSDGSAFDKHVQEPFMVAIENYYSSYYEPTRINFDYVGFLAQFRKKKQIVISKNEKEVSLLEELLKLHKSYNSKFFPIKGLDSGKTSVHADGKKNRLATEVSIVSLVYKDKLSKMEKLGILKGFTVLRGEPIGWKKDILYFDINSSDDHKSCTLNYLIKKIRKVVNTNNESAVKEFLPIEEDPEFLSMIIYLDDNFKFHYKPNLSRRVASLLKPEHSTFVDINNGIIKDIQYSFEDKLNAIKNYGPIGEEIINKFLYYFKQIFNMDFWQFIKLKIDKYTINTGDLELHEYADLNSDEKLLLNDIDKYFYKVDQSKIRNSLLEHLFWNIDVNRLKVIFDKLGYPYVIKKDVDKDMEIKKLRKEALNGFSRNNI